ncbi:MAG: hypothetical protein IJT48_07685 [Bacteroidaceae bacterium]|nr:hypothetical protein [Bacteroidaceae bacterium]
MQLSKSVSVSTIESGVSHYITTTVPSVTIAAGASSASLNATIRFYEKEGSAAQALYSCYNTAFLRKGTTYTRITSTSYYPAYGTKRTSATLKYTCTTAYDAIVVRMYDSATTSSSAAWLAQLEIPILKNGDTGPKGDDAVTHEVRLSSATFAYDTVGGVTPLTILASFLKKVGDGSPVLESVYYTAKFAEGTNAAVPGTGSSVTIPTPSPWSPFPITVSIWEDQEHSQGIPLATATINIVRDGQNGQNGQNGTNGERGKTGRFYYYAGKWEDFASSTEFAVSDAQAPYFFYDDNYWVFNPTANGVYTKQQMGMPRDATESDPSGWLLMLDDFKFIITEAIFGKYAKFGSAIINGDWLISANGTIGGVAYNDGAIYTSEEQTMPGMSIGGAPTMTVVTPAVSGAAYTFFNPEFYDQSFHGNQEVGGKEWYGYNFVPRYALDLRCGDFHANTGTFGGWLRHVPRLITAENILNFVTKASRKVNGTGTDVCVLDIRKTGPSFVLYDLDPTGALPDEDMRMESLATVLDEEYGCDQLWLDLPWCSTHVSVNGTVYGWASAQVQVDSAAFGFREAYAAVGNTVHVWNYSSANLYVDGGLAFKGSEDAVPEKEASEMVAGDALECGGEMFATSEISTLSLGSGTGVAARWIQWWRQPANAGGYTYPHSLPYRSFALQIAGD